MTLGRRSRWLPLMRQQLCNAASRVRRKPLENILQVRVRLVAVQTRRVHQAHDGRSSLAGAQAAGEQPVLSTDDLAPERTRMLTHVDFPCA